MKTLTQLKKDAQTGNMLLKMIYRMGDTEENIPDRLKGFREVVGSNTVSLMLKIVGSDKTSELRLGPASLVEYDGDTLKIFDPGYRECTEPEKRALTEAENLCAERPYSEPYWIKKAYFMKSLYPWMSGYDTIKGKKYDWSRKMVQDNRVKGDLCLAYEVKMNM